MGEKIPTTSKCIIFHLGEQTGVIVGPCNKFGVRKLVKKNTYGNNSEPCEYVIYPNNINYSKFSINKETSYIEKCCNFLICSKKSTSKKKPFSYDGISNNTRLKIYINARGDGRGENFYSNDPLFQGVFSVNYKKFAQILKTFIFDKIPSNVDVEITLIVCKAAHFEEKVGGNYVECLDKTLAYNLLNEFKKIWKTKKEWLSVIAYSGLVIKPCGRCIRWLFGGTRSPSGLALTPNIIKWLISGKKSSLINRKRRYSLHNGFIYYYNNIDNDWVYYVEKFIIRHFLYANKTEKKAMQEIWSKLREPSNPYEIREMERKEIENKRKCLIRSMKYRLKGHDKLLF